MDKYKYTERQAQVGELIEDGMTLQEIAEQLNVTYSNVNQHIRNYQRKKISNQIRQDYLNGESIENLALKNDYDMDRVQRLVSDIVKPVENYFVSFAFNDPSNQLQISNCVINLNKITNEMNVKALEQMIENQEEYANVKVINFTKL